MAGRPHKFTRDHVDRLLRGVRMGLTYRLACMYAGISEDLFSEWRNGKFPRGLTDEQKQMKSDFSDLLARAEGDAAARHVSTIMQAAAQGDAQVSIKFLERRWPDDFATRKVEITGKDGGPVQFEARAAKLIEAEAKSLGIEGSDVDELQQAFIDYINSRDGDDE